MTTLSGEATLLFSFLPPHEIGSTLKKKNWLPKEQMFSILGLACSVKGFVIQGSKHGVTVQKLSPSVKMAEKPGVVPIHLK